MSPALDLLPLEQIQAPASADEVAACLRAAAIQGQPVYPVGGGTWLDFGLPASETGVALSTAALNTVIDYPARDLTITVGAGITLETLSATLATENQWLPLDPPAAAEATLGGLIATNANGPRRLGFGTVRDYVIGISAVDGAGRPFQAGGRVVKNVAGYDFCKLLTGSLGTLAVVTQVTLRLRPRTLCQALVTCGIRQTETMDGLLARLATTQTTPTAVEWLAGSAWDPVRELTSLPHPHLLTLSFEGSEREVAWMIERIQSEWREFGIQAIHVAQEDVAGSIWQALHNFGLREAPLQLRVAVVSSGMVEVIQAARSMHSECSIQAHAASGIATIEFPDFPEEGLARSLISKLRPVAAAHQGNIIVLGNPGRIEMTHSGVWGNIGASQSLMKRIKDQFDPQNILNRGRFIFA